MFDISNNGIISLTRGDCASAPLFINQGSEVNPIRYRLTDNDIVYIGICEPNQPFENAIVRKKYTKDNWEKNSHGDLIVSFETNDTEHLECGLYYYIVKLVTIQPDNSEYVQTLIQKTKMFVED